jgi:hypothetical protein
MDKQGYTLTQTDSQKIWTRTIVTLHYPNHSLPRPMASTLPIHTAPSLVKKETNTPFQGQDFNLPVTINKIASKNNQHATLIEIKK